MIKNVIANLTSKSVCINNRDTKEKNNLDLEAQSNTVNMRSSQSFSFSKNSAVSPPLCSALLSRE